MELVGVACQKSHLLDIGSAKSVIVKIVSQTKSATIVALKLKESLQKVDKNEVLY